MQKNRLVKGKQRRGSGATLWLIAEALNNLTEEACFILALRTFLFAYFSGHYLRGNSGHSLPHKLLLEVFVQMPVRCQD